MKRLNNPGRGAKAVVRFSLACAVALMAGAAHAQLVSVEFAQLDLMLNNVATINSAWGRCDVTYIGASEVLYLNLAVNGEQRVENLPILSVDGPGVVQTMSVHFDLGVSDGEDMPDLEYAIQLGVEVLDTWLPAQTEYLTAPVVQGDFVMDNGQSNELVAAEAPLPRIKGFRIGGQAVVLTGLPNVECRRGECVHAAVSNSLRRLNTASGLGLDDNVFNIASMRGVFRTPAGSGIKWAMQKMEFLFKAGIPIWTYVYFPIAVANNPRSPAKVVEAIHSALLRGAAVEACSKPHCVAVCGGVKLANGDYVIVYRHDSRQGQNGGLETGATIIRATQGDGSFGKFLGGSPWLSKQFVEGIVIENKL